MEYKNILYAVENRVAKITLHVPEKMNALSAELVAELLAALRAAEEDRQVKAVVLTGAGKAFCAGGDVGGFEPDLEAGIALTKAGRGLVDAFSNLPKPVVAAVNGYAVGAGLSLTLLCDIVIAAENAKFGAAFVNMGLIPDTGCLYFLPRLIGMQKAKEFVFSGRNVSALEALRMNLISQMTPLETLLETAVELAENLARKAGLSIAMSKNILNRSMQIGLYELLEMEAYAQGICMVSNDSKEAVDAFLHKRKPVFQ